MEAQLLEMRGFLERLHVTPQISNVPGAENFEDPTTKVLEAYIESVHSVIESSVRGEGSVLSLGDAATVADTGPESAETAITEPDSSAEDLGMEELDRWLGSVEYRNSYTAFVRRRFADSNLWIFEQTATKHWFGLRPGYSLLWINGVAGTGMDNHLGKDISR